MEIYNTGDPTHRPPMVMMVYGEGGVGKTTFASTAPSPIMADCEGGVKYLGLREVSIDYVPIGSWSDFKEFMLSFNQQSAKSRNQKDIENYSKMSAKQVETIIIDPIGELMMKLHDSIVASGESAFVNKIGGLTKNGWGELKKRMRAAIKYLIGLNKHVLIIAHVDESTDDESLIKRPKMITKFSSELFDMVDVVGYMTRVTQKDGISKRAIYVDANSDRFIAKDRTGMLGRVIEPDFQKIVQACQGTKTFKWSKPTVAAKVVAPAAKPVEEPPVQQPQPENNVPVQQSEQVGVPAEMVEEIFSNPTNDGQPK